MPEILLNPHRDPTIRHPDPTLAPRAFHRRLPGYEPTPLRSLDTLARDLGVGRLLVKDESRRLMLPAFKVLGASWAVFRWAGEQLGHPPWDWDTVEELRTYLRPLGHRTLVTATDGNHGLGVAQTAAWFGWAAKVFFPTATVPARMQAIMETGAELKVLERSYDETVAHAREIAAATPGSLLVQDTSWPGYEDIPGWIMDGYSTLLWEIEDALQQRELPAPDLVVAPVGVGALAVAMARHFRREELDKVPRLLGVEALPAACLLASLRAGQSVTVPAEGETIMAGLHCGTLASLAWPVLRNAIDTSVAIEDGWAEQAVALYDQAGVETGASGASSLAGLLAMFRSTEGRDIVRQMGLNADSTVLLVNTEGSTATDRS